ncbi:MAG: phosphatidylinositol-3-phosphatase [Verrucomicrobiota bacterium]|jgi:acid phosphatase
MTHRRVPIRLSLLFALAASAPGNSARAQIPQYAHVVVVVEENHNFSEIIGSPSAPYITDLAANSALFTSSHGTEHPSQPNYLDLYSGFNQGVVADNTSLLAPFTTANLGASLFKAGFTFSDYSESLPYSLPGNRSVAVAPGTPGATAYGFTGDSYSAHAGLTEYERKHNPSVNWQNETNPGANQLPATTNQPFTAFPTDFSLLPTVSFVIPNQQNDMHDGTIQMGDTWLLNNIEAYRQWALTHNSLLIVTFDEGSEDTNTPVDGAANRVVTLFSGQGVNTGQYSEPVTHFSVLRTLEDMYNLPTSGAGDLEAMPIIDVFAVPEPNTLALVAAGICAALAAFIVRRKWRAPPEHEQVLSRKRTALVSTGIAIAISGFAMVDLRAATVIAPNELPDPNSAGNLPATQTYGDTSNLFPLFPGAGTSLRYQQIYDASQFTALSPGGEDITEILFRVGSDAATRLDHGAFATTIPAIEFTLSTTSATPDNLNGTFTNNPGADATTVYGIPGTGSPLAVSSSGSASGNPAPFDIVVLLTTPFRYDPSKGNLLLDIQNFAGAASPTGIELDGTFAAGDSVSRAYNFGNVAAATANNSDTIGVVTEFVTVPEPGVVSLLVVALSLPVTLRMRRRGLTR